TSFAERVMKDGHIETVRAFDPSKSLSADTLLSAIPGPIRPGLSSCASPDRRAPGTHGTAPAGQAGHCCAGAIRVAPCLKPGCRRVRANGVAPYAGERALVKLCPRAGLIRLRPGNAGCGR